MTPRRRNRTEQNLGIAMIVLTILGFVAMFTYAYQVDKAHGITPCQSLAMWGMHVC